MSASPNLFDENAPISRGSVDPFSDIKDASRDDFLVEQGRERDRTVKPGASKRKTTVSPESLTRELYRKRGYFYGRTETLESHYYSQFSVKKDLFGIVDSIAVKPCEEVVFLQSTTLNGKSSHFTKLITGQFKIGNGAPTSILPVIAGIIGTPGCRFVLCCWHQPGGFKTPWVCEEIDVTPELIETLKKRRKL